MTTRLDELAGRDDGTAYSTTLRHVGALQRMLDLAALGMGLGSAALALSYGSLADDALGLDYPAEVSIAEMTVGGIR